MTDVAGDLKRSYLSGANQVQVRPHCFNENAPQFVPAAPMWPRIALQNQQHIVSYLPSDDLFPFVSLMKCDS